MTQDVLLIHPPSVYDFRKRVIFPGPIAYTVGESTDQFIIPPIGMLSIADYLDRHGYRAAVDNLGERMVTDGSFDAESYLRRLSARVFGVGLHWSVHSQGAIEVARLLKRFHPESIVLLGGLTATRFHSEIIQRYEFVDAVIRGEAEEPFVKFMQTLETRNEVPASPNVTYRSDGMVRQEPNMTPRASIDDFEFTRLDLLSPKGAIYSAGMPPHWSLPVSRGCAYNCATCGGSSYSYKTYLRRSAPAFRSPQRIAEDIQKLSDQNVRLVFLFQDPRMGGVKYQHELISTLRSARPRLDGLTMELFSPAGEEYVRELSSIGVPLTLTISPESGNDRARMVHGRRYTSEALFTTIGACHKYAVRLMVFFMTGLANETKQTAEEMWSLWERIYSTGGSYGTVMHSYGPMVLLDPGSPAFDYPEEFGYKLKSKTLEDYINAMSNPSWHQWMSYETRNLDRDALVALVIDSLENSIDVWERHGIYSRAVAAAARRKFVDANRLAIERIDALAKARQGTDYESSLALLRKAVDQLALGDR